MTYEREQDVVGWHRHTTDGKFESVAVIPHQDLDREQAWVIVNRTIEAATKRYVEYLDNKFTLSDHHDQLNVDSGLSYSGAAASTLTGLDHLEGETVKVVGNGAVYPDKVVASGQITGLYPTVTQAEVGLSYVSKLVTMRPEKPELVSIHGLPKSYSKLSALLHKTLGITMGDQLVTFRKALDPTDEPPPVFTGFKTISKSGWDDDGRITIEQTQPLPFEILVIVGELDVGE